MREAAAGGGVRTKKAQRGRTRDVLVEREFRLATPVPASYTYSFHAFGCASVAQWQSTGFVNRWLWVQVPPLASLAEGEAIALMKVHARPVERKRGKDSLSKKVAGDNPFPAPSLSGSGSSRQRWADGRAANGTRL